MADPHKADEFVLDAATAKAFGYHLGEEIPVGWLTNAQANSGNLALELNHPRRPTGEGEAGRHRRGQATNLFQDQDEAQGQSIMLFTPALTDKLLACCSNTMLTALTLQDGNRYLSAVETEIKGVLPKGLPFVYVQVEDRVAIANDTLRPEAIALAVFGGIAGIAALLIAGQVVSRRIRLKAADLDIIRALGASPSMTFCDDLIGTLGAVARRLRPGRGGGPLPLAAGAAGAGAAVPARRGARRLGGDRSRRGRPPAVARRRSRPWLRGEHCRAEHASVANEPPRRG